MSTYYNENDAYAAEWLRNLIANGENCGGIVEVQANDLRDFAHVHFFAGITKWGTARVLVFREASDE